jgi:ligand-binding sensor domain-containing protein
MFSFNRPTLKEIIVLSLFICSAAYSQKPSWQTFFCGREAFSVATKGKDLYAGTNFGFVRINLDNDKVSLFDKTNTNYVLTNAMHLYIMKNGVVIFGKHASQTIFKYNPQNSSLTQGSLVQMLCAAENSNGDLFVGGSYEGIEYAKYSDYYGVNIWYQYNQSNSPLPGDNVTGLYFDKDQNLWILVCEYDDRTNSKGGLIKFDGKNWTIYDKSNSPIPTYRLSTMAVDKNGDFWIGMEDGYGLLKFSKGEWTRYDIPIPKIFGFGKPTVTSLAIDSLNNVWVGTLFTGLYMFDGKTWKAYHASNSNLISSYINSVAVDYKNRIWVATQIGLYRKEGDSFIEYNTSNSPIPYNRIVKAISDSKGNLWILNNDYGSPSNSSKNTEAITKWDGNTFNVFYTWDIAKGQSHIFSITADQSDNIWAAASNCLYKFDGAEWTKHSFDPGYGDYQPEKICADLFDNIWIGTFFGDIVKVKEKNCTVFRASSNHLPGGTISSIKSAGKYVYITYENDGNIYQIDALENKSNLSVKIIDTPAADIRAIYVGYKNEIWVACNQKGLFKYDGTDWVNYDNNNSGLPNDAVVAIDLDKQGNVFAVCGFNYGSPPWEGGLAYYDRKEWQTYIYGNSNLALIGLNGGFLDARNNLCAYNFSGLSVFNQQGINTDTIMNAPVNFISQNFPNPANGSTLIKYSIANPTHVRITIYDMLGREVVTIIDEFKQKGNYTINWNGNNKFGNIISSGVYLYSLSTSEGTTAKKIVWMK